MIESCHKKNNWSSEEKMVKFHMIKTLKKIIRKRKAISPVVSALLLIALVVASVAFAYFIIIPFLNKSNLFAEALGVRDSNKDSRYDEMTLFLSNTGTKEVEIATIIVWTAVEGEVGNQAAWVKHEGWNFTRATGGIVQAGTTKKETIFNDQFSQQIELTIKKKTFYRLELTITGSSNHYFSDWKVLNDQVDFSDLMDDFETFDLQAWGFEGTIDVPGWTSNNYFTYGGPEYGPIQPNQYLYLPVINETDWVKFYVTGKIVIFHSTNGNLTNQPTFLQINRTAKPFKARKLFLLGLAGSWGDEFPNDAWALKINVTYTDGTSSIWELGHEYIDDWYYSSNADTSPTHSAECVSAPYGMITEIDLGYQVDWPHVHIHTHTAGFELDFFKYVQYISFTDPGNDASGPHLLSITAG